MNIKEAKTLLTDFKDGKIERDKLELYKGGYKMGYFYTTDIQQAIETYLIAYENISRELIARTEKLEQVNRENLEKDNKIEKMKIYTKLEYIPGAKNTIAICGKGCRY